MFSNRSKIAAYIPFDLYWSAKILCDSTTQIDSFHSLWQGSQTRSKCYAGQRIENRPNRVIDRRKLVEVMLR